MKSLIVRDITLTPRQDQPLRAQKTMSTSICLAGSPILCSSSSQQSGRSFSNIALSMPHSPCVSSDPEISLNEQPVVESDSLVQRSPPARTYSSGQLLRRILLGSSPSSPVPHSHDKEVIQEEGYCISDEKRPTTNKTCLRRGRRPRISCSPARGRRVCEESSCESTQHSDSSSFHFDDFPLREVKVSESHQRSISPLRFAPNGYSSSEEDPMDRIPRSPRRRRSPPPPPSKGRPDSLFQTSCHGSPDPPMFPRRRGSVAPTDIPPSTIQCKPPRRRPSRRAKTESSSLLIPVAPGVQLPLGSAQDTLQAVRDGASTRVQCLLCEQTLTAPNSGALFVYCPACKSTTASRQVTTGEPATSIGMGMLASDLQELLVDS